MERIVDGREHLSCVSLGELPVSTFLVPVFDGLPVGSQVSIVSDLKSQLVNQPCTGYQLLNIMRPAPFLLISLVAKDHIGIRFQKRKNARLQSTFHRVTGEIVSR